MVISRWETSWSVRLTRLRGLVADQVEGPAWLWTIRIRILEYLLARYGVEHSAGFVDSRDVAARTRAALGLDDDDQDPVIAGDQAPIEMSRSMQWAAGLEHPPRDRQVIGPVLADIQETNQIICPTKLGGQDLVWEWWRTTWCCRRE